MSIQKLGLKGFHTILSLPNNDLTTDEVSNIAGQLVNRVVLVICEQEVR